MSAAEREAWGPAVRRLADWDPRTLESLAEAYGTPLYVMDLDRVRANARRFRDAFPDARLLYAAKAHAGRAVLETVADAGYRIEAAARGEVRRAVEAGVDPADVQYTGVNPPDPDLDAVVERWREHPGLTVTVGAEMTLDRLADRGFDGRLCLRVNPGVGMGHHEKVATGSHPKFGVPADRVPDVLADARERFDVVGLHAHAGSGILDPDDLDAHAAYVERMGELARAVGDLEFLDLGGGFGVPYRDDEAPLDLPAVAERIRAAVGDVDARLAFEPGRYLVADAGVLLARVNTVKETPETTVVGVDAGMTTLIRPAMYGAYHPIRNVTRPDAEPVSATVGGPVCESSDVLAADRELPRPEYGDLLAVGVVGAYGYEMASTFHSQPRPAEVVLEGEEARLGRRRETVDDLLAYERD
ncbi:MAG: diaminopimelate decarboxylase [Halobacteriales archaeon]